MAICRFSKWRPSAILELLYYHTRLPTKFPLLSAAACQISCQSDTQIILRIEPFEFFAYLAWSAYSGPQNGGFGWLWTAKCDYHRDPQKAHHCVNSRLLSIKLSTVKIRWGVWPVGKLTKSVTDTHTDRHTLTHTQVNLYAVLVLVLVIVGRRVQHELRAPHSLANLFLNVLTVSACTTFSDNLFQWLVTLWLKKFRRNSRRLLVVSSL